MNNWISLKDRLPSKHTYVLTYTPNCSHPIKIKWVFTNLIKEIMNSKSRFYKVTHWQELPEKPKEES